MEGNLCFKIHWASLIVGRKFTIFALFYFVFEGNFPSTSPRGASIWRGDLMEGFLCYQIGGPIFGGLYMEGLIFGILQYWSFRLVISLKDEVKESTEYSASYQWLKKELHYSCSAFMCFFRRFLYWFYVNITEVRIFFP